MLSGGFGEPSEASRDPCSGAGEASHRVGGVGLVSLGARSPDVPRREKLCHLVPVAALAGGPASSPMKRSAW